MCNIDFCRTETRLFLPAYFQEELMAEIENHELKLLYDPRVNQTIYLLDNNHDYFFGPSLKARRYLNDYSSRILLSQIFQEEFFFEIKDSGLNDLRKKTKIGPENLLDILKFADQSFPGARAYFAVEYRRQHFGIDDNLRITIDTGFRFYYFTEDQDEAVCIKNCSEGIDKDIIRIEIKINPDYKKSGLYISFVNSLVVLGAKPIISKKQEALNAHKKWIDSSCATGHMQKELRDCEIEAKISLEKEPNLTLFSNLYNLFDPKITKGRYVIDETYSFMMSSASINHYWKGKAKNGYSNGLKVLTKALWARPVLKGSPKEWICGILERYEKKGEHFLWIDDSAIKDIFAQFDSLEYIGFIVRSRRAFWVVNKITQRIYHVSIDKCTIDNKSNLFQIEIEYSGIIRDATEEDLSKNINESIKEIVVKDISVMTQSIMYYLDNNEIAYSLGEEKLNWLIN